MRKETVLKETGRGKRKEGGGGEGGGERRERRRRREERKYFWGKKPIRDVQETLTSVGATPTPAKPASPCC